MWPRSSIKPYGAAKNLEAVGLGLTESEREKEEEASRRSLDLRPLGSSQRSLVLWLTINNTETIVKCLQAATRTRDNLVLNWACLVARKRNLTGHATPKTIRMKRPPQPSSSDLSGRKNHWVKIGGKSFWEYKLTHFLASLVKQVYWEVYALGKRRKRR